MAHPRNNLAPESQDWVRNVEATLDDLVRSAERRSQNSQATDRAQSSSMDLLTNRLGDLQSSLVAAFATLTITASQVASGVLHEARIPRNLPGALGVGGSFTAVGGITAGGNSSISGTLSVSGNATVTGDLFLPNSFLAASGYTVAYIDGTGRLARGASSARFKRNIQSWTPQMQAIFAMRLVTFYYTDEVLNGADPRREVGVIAEELMELGLNWLVYFNDEGLPMGVHYERISLALLPAIQNLNERVTALEEKQ